MRRVPFLTYPFALIVLVWAELGIMRVALPMHHNPLVVIPSAIADGADTQRADR